MLINWNFQDEAVNSTTPQINRTRLRWPSQWSERPWRVHSAEVGYSPVNCITYCFVCVLSVFLGNTPVNGALGCLPRCGLIELRWHDDGPEAKFVGCWCKIERGIVVNGCVCLYGNHTYYWELNGQDVEEGDWELMQDKPDVITLTIRHRRQYNFEIGNPPIELKGFYFLDYRTNGHLRLASLFDKRSGWEFQKAPIKLY